VPDNQCTPELLWRLPRVGNPAPATDGSFCITPVTTYDVAKNEGFTRLWIRRGETLKPLTGEGESATQPAISPDGRRLAFVRKAPASDKPGAEKPQLWLLELDGGEPVQITWMPLGVADPHWFPDGTRVGFISALHAGNFTPEATAKEEQRRKAEKVKAKVSEDRFFRFWDHWIHDGPWQHFWALDVESRELRDLTFDMQRFLPLMDVADSWDLSPDGAELAFTANRTAPPYDQLINGVYRLSIEGGEPRLISEWTASHAFRPRYSPDGSYIVFGAQEDNAFYADRVRLVAYERDTGRKRMLTENWDRSPSEWEFADNSHLVINAEDRGAGALYTLRLDESEPSQLARGGSYNGVSIAGGRVWCNAHELTKPPECISLALSGNEERKLTDFSAGVLADVKLGEARELYFEGAEGAQVQMWVILPPGVSDPRKLPLVHLIHGGPHGAFGDGWQWRWNPQAWAAKGWLTVLVNFHGSTGWGQDFAKCIQGEWGKRPYEDIMRATDALIARGWVDEQRMAAAGGSYGGYLVSWIAANTDRFKCLVNHAGVSDLQAQYARDVTPGREKALGGEPWGDQAGMDRYSPMRHSKGFKTPMLVIHGEQDYRVPYTQGLQTYNAYKAQGREARLVVYPDENHWILKPQNSIHWYKEVLGWIERWIG
jgi:dipeptidyl aminopeptidase/acylaminoacyl peptidase